MEESRKKEEGSLREDETEMEEKGRKRIGADEGWRRDGRLSQGGMKGYVRKNGGKIEVGFCRKDDRCLKRQKCLSPEVERVRQL